MALEEQIVAWASTRPGWQRSVLRQVATGKGFTEKDYDELIDLIDSPIEGQDASFNLAHLPQVEVEDPPVQLTSIAKPKHVNAIESEKPLTFGQSGLTIVYGDNGSGKSGYARLLKRIMRSRHKEDVLSDVFRDTALAKPTASLAVRIGDAEAQLEWPESTPPELQRMLYYDGKCSEHYVDAESDFPYRPSALFVIDGLIDVCVKVRSRIDERLEENSKQRQDIPEVDDDVKETPAGKFLSDLTERSSLDVLNGLIKQLDGAGDTIEGLKAQENKLHGSDTTKERQNLIRQEEKLEALRKQIEDVHALLGDDGLKSTQKSREHLKTLQEASELITKSFKSEPLPGVGTPVWKALWDSARRFSEGYAYPLRTFPVVEGGAQCVLCQQNLDPQGRDRLTRFDQFVKDDTQVRLQGGLDKFNGMKEAIRKLVVSPEAVEGTLKDLTTNHPGLMDEVKQTLAQYERAREQALQSLEGDDPIKNSGLDPASVLDKVSGAAAEARKAAEALGDPELVKKRLSETTARRKELELLARIKKSRNTITAEIARRQQRDALEAAKSTAATGPITKKILELSEAGITEVVRDTFTRETERLLLDRVTIAKARADRGALLHQPKLVGARQEVTLPRVFSEGEQTALGLAALFTEAQLDSSRSAIVLDDPVNSLDHVRRSLVAARLVTLAESRQVVIFTHDVAFVADLKRDAHGKGVSVSERSVTRSRKDERKPGTCIDEHPWKAKDVPARFDELRKELVRMKSAQAGWDDKTYEQVVANWAGNLSETWERIFSQEIVGRVLAEGGLEVRPMMVKVLAKFTEDDHREFDASYSRISQWAKRHDKSPAVNYVAPDTRALEEELDLVETWFKQVKGYKNK